VCVGVDHWLALVIHFHMLQLSDDRACLNVLVTIASASSIAHCVHLTHQCCMCCCCANLLQKLLVVVGLHMHVSCTMKQQRGSSAVAV
jgi:hypothetical protein